MSHVRTLGAGRRRSEIEKPRGPRTAPDRTKGLEEDGAGPSNGGGERGIFKHKGQGQARWAFRAWGSGGDGIISQAYAAGRSRLHLATTEASFMPD